MTWVSSVHGTQRSPVHSINRWGAPCVMYLLPAPDGGNHTSEPGPSTRRARGPLRLGCPRAYEWERGVDFPKVRDLALRFRSELDQRKERVSAGIACYPYDTMSNIINLDTLLTGENRDIFARIAGSHVADIGCADGDFGYFLERELGCTVDLVDNAPTNFNQLRGARAIKELLSSNARILEIDLDAQFSLPAEPYTAVFFLGLLYHLRNPYFV